MSDAEPQERPDLHPKEREAICTWLAQKMGVSREQSSELPDELLAALGTNPSASIPQLLAQLERKKMPSSRLRSKARELTSRLDEVRQSIARITATPSPLPETVDESEQKLDQMIGRVEQSFLEFETQVREAAAQTQLPPYLSPDNLYAPFDAVRENQSNAQRNIIRRRRRIQAGEESNQIALGHPYHFFYDFQRPHPGLPAPSEASFSAVERTMHLPEQFNPDAISKKLVQYHEVRHANQDAVIRLNMRSEQDLQAYIGFLTGRAGQKPKVIVTEEATTYGCELEVLNILLKGALHSGKKPSISSALQQIGGTKEDEKIIKMLLTLSDDYYPEGMTNSVFTSRYLNRIKDMHLAAGYDVYVHTQGGSPRKLDHNPL